MGTRSRNRKRKQLPEGLHVDAFGERIDLSLRPGAREVPTTARAFCTIGFSDFGGTCPLCVRPLATTPSGKRGEPEHVPPFAVGGTARTRTCPGCNRASSALEAELVRWWAKEYPVCFEAPGLRGFRRSGVLLRGTVGGKFTLVVGGRGAQGVRDVMGSAGLTGQFTGTFTLPNADWRVALLKAAYLAACVHLDEVPDTPDAAYARKVVKDRTFGREPATVGVGIDSVPFRIFRMYDVDDSDARKVWVGIAGLPWAGSNVPIFGVGLGAVAFVTWPLPDLRNKAIKRAIPDVR